jgi:hypothetical protein
MQSRDRILGASFDTVRAWPARQIAWGILALAETAEADEGGLREGYIRHKVLIDWCKPLQSRWYENTQKRLRSRRGALLSHSYT